MKGTSPKLLVITVILFLIQIPAAGQNGNGSIYNSEEDSINCLKNRSTYREFYRIKLYNDALDSWWAAFNDCPASSERIYVDGVSMYRSFIDAAPDGPIKEGLIDTLLLIYDQRMEYFGNEGNVLGRKGKDLLTYRSSDIEAMQNAYGMLKKSVEIQGKKSQDQVMIYYITSGLALNKQNKIETNQVIEDYFMVMALLDELEGRSSRWKKAKETIEALMLKENILSCEALNSYYEPQFEANQEDKDFLNKVISIYSNAGCDRSDLYVAASEKLYEIEPGSQSAHQLFILFIAKSDYTKAEYYLKMAVLGEDLDNATRGEWYYELALVSRYNENYCAAIRYAKEAIGYKSDLGKAYMVLGDAIIDSRDNLGEDFQQRTAFWVAADKYQKAISVDPSVEQEARKKLADYAGQYPNSEEVFFRDFKDGDPYQVGGCINENTTVRSRK